MNIFSYNLISSN